MKPMKFDVTLNHDQHGQVVTQVELSADDIVTQYEDIIAKARKNAASRFVDYESFGNDSAYSDRLDEVGDEFDPLDVTVADGEPKVRWRIYGHYSADDGGTWCDWVFASSSEEAEFKGKWEMAVNECSEPSRTSDFQATMEDIEIYDCDLEPITKEEAIAGLKVCRAAIQAFIDKVDAGEALSTRSYAAFKAALENSKVPA